MFEEVLPEGYDGWTGEVGLLAMLLLNEMARLDVGGGKGIDLPKRKEGMQTLFEAWVLTLPSLEEMKEMNPLLWEEEDQELLQSSSTKKIYRLLDDIEDNLGWLEEIFVAFFRAIGLHLFCGALPSCGLEHCSDHASPCFLLSIL